eukprot:301441-Hanusia_phi.AAC.1
MLSLAKISAEAARRHAGTLGSMPEESKIVSGPPPPSHSLLHDLAAALTNAQVQFRPEGVRMQEPSSLWELEKVRPQHLRPLLSCRSLRILRPPESASSAQWRSAARRGSSSSFRTRCSCLVTGRQLPAAPTSGEIALESTYGE